MFSSNNPNNSNNQRRLRSNTKAQSQAQPSEHAKKNSKSSAKKKRDEVTPENIDSVKKSSSRRTIGKKEADSSLSPPASTTQKRKRRSGKSSGNNDNEELHQAKRTKVDNSETTQSPITTPLVTRDNNNNNNNNNSILPPVTSTASIPTTEGQLSQEDLLQVTTSSSSSGNSSPPESPRPEFLSSSTPSDSNNKHLNELLDPIYNLRNFLANVLSKLPKEFPTQPLTSSTSSTVPPHSSLSSVSVSASTTTTESSPTQSSVSTFAPSTLQPQFVWGKLLSQIPEHPHALLAGSTFTIGRHPNCNLSIRDIGISNVLCRLHFAQMLCCAFIECTSNGCTLAVNGRILRKGGKLIMRSGDEITITTTKTYSFIYQQLINSPIGSVVHIPPHHHHHLIPSSLVPTPLRVVPPSIVTTTTTTTANATTTSTTTTATTTHNHTNTNSNSENNNDKTTNTSKTLLPNIVITPLQPETQQKATLTNNTSTLLNENVANLAPNSPSLAQQNNVRIEESTTTTTSLTNPVSNSSATLSEPNLSQFQSLQQAPISNNTNRVDSDIKALVTTSNQLTDIENTLNLSENTFQSASQAFPSDNCQKLPVEETTHIDSMENTSNELPNAPQTKPNNLTENGSMLGNINNECDATQLSNDSIPVRVPENIGIYSSQKTVSVGNDNSSNNMNLNQQTSSNVTSGATQIEDHISENSNRAKTNPYFFTLSPQIPVINHNNSHVVVTQQFTSPSMFSTLKLPAINSISSAAQIPPQIVENEDKSDSIQQGKDIESIKSHWRQTFQQLMVPSKDIPISFQNFPYHLNNNLKRLLVNSVYIFLEQPNYVKYTSELTSVSRKILLSGPSGSEIMQEKLVNALAVHFKANLLTIDPLTLMTQENCSPKENSHLETIDDDVAETWLSLGTEMMQRRPFRKGDKVKYIGTGASPYSRSTTWSTTGTTNDTTPLPSVAMASGVAATAATTNVRKNENPMTTTNIRGPQYGATGKVVLTFDDNPRKVGVRFDKPIPGGTNLGGLCEDQHGFFVDSVDLKHENDLEEGVEGLIVEALFEVIAKPENQPCILLIKNLEKTISANYERYTYFKKELDKLSGCIVVIGISTSDDSQKELRHTPSFLVSKPNSSTHTALMDIAFLDHLRSDHVMKESNKSFKLASKLFPHKITLYPPQETDKLQEWEKLIRNDVEKMRADINLANLKKIMEKNNVACNDGIDTKRLRKKILSTAQLEKVVAWSISDHLMSSSKSNSASLTQNTNTNTTPSNINYDNNNPTNATGTIPKLLISPKSVQHALALLEHAKPPKLKSIFDIETDNDFEKRLLSDVIPPNELGIRFDDIGALDSVKETLKELVMLPLQRPELFRKGNLTKPTKGILLFGPPGTGKTMLAKAVATESGANFINVSMASISSKWFGEAEKYARAVFTLASKIAPSVIFIDEVDSILGRRDKHGEHEAMRKIKNEFMAMWDGLKTKEGERVLVLAATNRPFDLDDAVLRRLPRRLLVDLPDAPNRKKILKVILAKEDLAPEVDLDALAEMTEGFSGSDLKNLCIAAAYQPIREILEKEKKEKEEKEHSNGSKNLTLNDKEGMEFDPTSRTNMEEELEPVEKPTPYIRPLTMKDFEKAKKEVCASVNEDAVSITELRKWNEMYGVNGSRSKPILSYFV